MLQRVILAAVFGVIVIGASVAAAPTAQCQGNCPAYNSTCISNVNCGYKCGMSCVRVPGDYRKRCR